jgi:hypothetical protein
MASPAPMPWPPSRRSRLHPCRARWCPSIPARQRLPAVKTLFYTAGRAAAMVCASSCRGRGDRVLRLGTMGPRRYRVSRKRRVPWICAVMEQQIRRSSRRESRRSSTAVPDRFLDRHRCVDRTGSGDQAIVIASSWFSNFLQPYGRTIQPVDESPEGPGDNRIRAVVCGLGAGGRVLLLETHRARARARADIRPGTIRSRWRHRISDTSGIRLAGSRLGGRGRPAARGTPGRQAALEDTPFATPVAALRRSASCAADHRETITASRGRAAGSSAGLVQASVRMVWSACWTSCARR